MVKVKKTAPYFIFLVAMNVSISAMNLDQTLTREDYKKNFTNLIGGVKDAYQTEFGNSAESLGSDVSAGFFTEFNKEIAEGSQLRSSLGQIAIGILMLTAAQGTVQVLTVAGTFFIQYIYQKYVYYLGKPAIIKVSSQKTKAELLMHLLMQKKIPKQKVDFVLPEQLKERMENIIAATQVIHESIQQGKQNVKYRNLLLYGKPGTGKTYFAEKIAKESGLEFAVVSGSSLAGLPSDHAISELDNLFNWARGTKGLVLFIDEIDSFLLDRSQMKNDSDQYKVLNHFLSLTGERSDRFMIVGATNRKNVLDEAMERRFDDLIEVPLPDLNQRQQVLELYKNKILGHRNNSKQFIERAKEIITDQKLHQMAQKTEGLSNGDLQGIINAIQTDATLQEDGLVSEQLVDEVVTRWLDKHEQFNVDKQPKFA